MNGVLSEAGKFIKDLFDLITQLFQMVGGDEAKLELIGQMLPNAITKVLTHEDFIKMYNVMIPVGVVLAVLYFSLDLMDKVAMEQVTVEKIILSLVKVVIGVALVNNGLLIFEGLNGFSLWMVELINGALGIDSTTLGSMELAKSDFTVEIAKSVWGVLKMLLAIFNPVALIAMASDLLTVLIFVFLIPIIAYQRAVKIGMYCLLAPIAISDTIGKDAINMRAVKYIFNLLKVFLEFPVIYYSCYLVFQLNDANVFSALTTKLSFLVVLVTVIMNSRESIKTMIGVS